jgi:hypothetical protein
MSSADKQLDDFSPDPAIVRGIEQRSRGEALTCAAAFAIAEDMGCPPAAVGKTADLMRVRLIKCQLGLFGYSPQKKIVQARTPQDPGLGDAIRGGLVKDRLPCKTAWDIAASFGLSKMVVSGACEALGIKIKPCQLGAF